MGGTGGWGGGCFQRIRLDRTVGVVRLHRRPGDALASRGGFMKSAFLAGVIACLVCVLVANPAVRAQGGGSSAKIHGTVVCPTGAIVPKALVVATEADRGIIHSTETDANGYYRLTGLPPETYDVAVRAPGVETVVQKGLSVNVGSITLVYFPL